MTEVNAEYESAKNIAKGRRGTVLLNVVENKCQIQLQCNCIGQLISADLNTIKRILIHWIRRESTSEWVLWWQIISPSAEGSIELSQCLFVCLCTILRSRFVNRLPLDKKSVLHIIIVDYYYYHQVGRFSGLQCNCAFERIVRRRAREIWMECI